MATENPQEKQFLDAEAAAAKQGDTVRSLKASLKDGKAEKVCNLSLNLAFYRNRKVDCDPRKT